MSTQEHSSDSALAAEYVLGVLSTADHAVVEARLRSDSALAAQVRFWQDHFAALDSEFAEQSVSPAVVAKLEHRLFGTQKSSLWDNLWLWRGLATGALAAVVVTIGLGHMEKYMAPPAAPQLVAAVEQAGSEVSFIVLFNPTTRQIRLTSLSGEPIPEHDYELWAIPEQSNPISMGVIPVNESAQMDVEPDMAQRFSHNTVFAVTVEPTGGSPTGTATGPIVASGQLRPI